MTAFSATISRLWSPLSSPVSKSSRYSQLFFILRPRIPYASPLFSSSHSTLSNSPSIPGISLVSNDSLESLPLEKSFFPGTNIEISQPNIFFIPNTEPSVPTPRLKMLAASNIALSNYATDAEVKVAEFVKACKGFDDCPKEGLPEFAFVGRSNVGKSSLVNYIVGRRKLAPISKEPGKTRMINHFRINNHWFLVDLPGYGFATVPKKVSKVWDEFTRDYILKRHSLVSTFLLIDGSIPSKAIDLDYARWLSENEIPLTIVFTKCDKRPKLKRGGFTPGDNVTYFLEMCSEIFENVPPWIMTSSKSRDGATEVLLHMAQLRNYWLRH